VKILEDRGVVVDRPTPLQWNQAIGTPDFLRFGSWIGGDRDGHPFVTAEVTALAWRMQARAACDEYLRRIDRLIAGESEPPDSQAYPSVGEFLNDLQLIDTSLRNHSDADIAKAYPWMPNLLPVFTSAVARPSTATAPNYNEVSTIFFSNVAQVLTGEQSGEDAVANIELDLQDLLGFETGAPQ